MFQVAALQQMGKLANPMTNEIERDLQQAKASIDMIEMLQEKAKGNLSSKEEEFLDKVLFELRMNYVDESDKESKEKADGEGDGKPEADDGRDAPADGDQEQPEEAPGASDEKPDPDGKSPGKEG
jgi:hypothetical protein